MKQVDGWWLPDGEEHMPVWWNHPRNHLMLNGRVSYQGKKQQAAIALCTQRRTAVDVGSHVGLWTYNLAFAFQTVRCFEPVDEHRSCFALNIEAQNVIIYPLALGAVRDNVGMRVNPRSSGDSWVSGVGNVAMEPLDAFGFDDVDFLKIDCEGYEENVLRGAVETILRCQPVVCVEQKRDMALKFALKPRGAVRYMETLHYRVAQEIAGDYLMVPA